METFKHLEFNVENNIAVITLNRPEAGNAFDTILGREINEVANLCLHDSSIRAVVLTGKGPLFCAGGDLSDMAQAGDRSDVLLKLMTDQIHGAYSTFLRMRAPLIVAVNGSAAGIGLSLTLVGDITIASEKSSFVMAYTAAGLSPDGGASYLLPRAIGMKRAKEMLLTNRKLTATEAEAWGMVNRVVPHDLLMSEAMKLAKAMSQGPTNAFGSVKTLLLSSYTESLESQMALESASIAKNSISQDGKEGIAAFMEKRRPDFKGL